MLADIHAQLSLLERKYGITPSLEPMRLVISQDAKPYQLFPSLVSDPEVTFDSSYLFGIEIQTNPTVPANVVVLQNKKGDVLGVFTAKEETA